MEFLMKVELNGQEVETTDTGFLVNLEDWNEDIAKVRTGVSLAKSGVNQAAVMVEKD